MKNPYFRYIGAMRHDVSYPDDKLAAYIEKYVFYENTYITNDTFLKMYSNGKVVLFIHYHDSKILMSNKQNELTLTSFIVGVSSLINTINIKPVSECRCLRGISVTFSFEGVTQLLGVPVKSLTNKVIPLDSVMGEKSNVLIERLSNAHSKTEREKGLNEFFLDGLNTKKTLNRLQSAYSLIMENKGGCSVNDLAIHLNLTPRTIHRMFTEEVGVVPKDYLKIIRFNHACKLLSRYPEIDWFEIICECGYYDQMHFIHEFKQIMKYTPARFLNQCRGNFYLNRPVVIEERE